MNFQRLAVKTQQARHLQEVLMSRLNRTMHFMRAIHILTLAALLAVAGCATASKMNQLSIGMAKQEVISVMGSPASTASPGSGVELLRYRLSPTDDHAFHGITEEYFVRLANGKVDSYGKMGDFDSTKAPTLNLNIKNR